MRKEVIKVIIIDRKENFYVTETVTDFSLIIYLVLPISAEVIEEVAIMTDLRSVLLVAIGIFKEEVIYSTFMRFSVEHVEVVN